jgi:hypothetical protein
MTAVFRGICRNCPGVNTHWEMRIDGTPVCNIDKNAVCGDCSRKKGCRTTGHPTKHACCPEISSTARAAKLAQWTEFVEKSKHEAGINNSDGENSEAESSAIKYCGHCHNMGVPDWACKTHYTRECKKMICEDCGEQGHLKSRCGRVQEEFNGCSHCREIGMFKAVYMSHSYDDCTFTCKYCNELHADHNPRDCPQNPKNEASDEEESDEEDDDQSQTETQTETQTQTETRVSTSTTVQLEISPGSAFTPVSGAPMTWASRAVSPASEQTLRAVFDQREKELKEMRELVLTLEEENRVLKAQDTLKELKEIHATSILSMQEEIESLKKELKKAQMKVKATEAAYNAVLEG